MSRDGKIDYSRFTRAQLEDALSRVDRAAYPLNYTNLTAELARRPLKVAAGSPSDPETRTRAELALPAWFQRAAASRAARVLTRAGVALIGILSGVGMLLSDLVPSELLGDVQTGSALIIGALGFVVAVSRRGPLFDVRRSEGMGRFEKVAWVRNDLLRAAFVALLGAALGVGAAQGTAWAYTVAFGVPAERTFTAMSAFGGTYWPCKRPLLEDVFIEPRRGLCFSTRYPKGTKIRVTGAQSHFGIRVESAVVIQDR